VKSIQVKHSGELGREYRERERDVANWGERERTEIMEENGVGFKRSSTWSKSTRKYFGISQMAKSTQRYFDTR
jgi:hypothetical protein